MTERPETTAINPPADLVDTMREAMRDVPVDLAEPLEGDVSALRETTPADLLRLLPDGPVSAWPDYEDWDDHECEWIVGVALRDLRGPGYRIEEGDERPGVWTPIAEVQGRGLAVALAAHLNALREAANG
jgi:hypothetical protein